MKRFDIEMAPPLLWPAVSSSPAEATAIKDLYANLYGVTFNVAAWQSALHLYEFSKLRHDCVQATVSREWRWIASHECVMQLYYLSERMKSIRQHKVRACGQLVDFIAIDDTRAAFKRLHEYFPDIDPLRHAIAHAGSVGTNPAKHSHDGFGLVGFRDHDTFGAPYEGTLRQLALSRESLDRIEEVARLFLGAFAPLATELERRGHAD